MSDLKQALTVISTFRSFAEGPRGEIGYGIAHKGPMVYRGWHSFFNHRARKKQRSAQLHGRQIGIPPSLTYEDKTLRAYFLNALACGYGKEALPVAENRLGSKPLTTRRIRRVFKDIDRDTRLSRARFLLPPPHSQSDPLPETYEALISELSNDNRLPTGFLQTADPLVLKELTVSLFDNTDPTLPHADRIEEVKNGIVRFAEQRQRSLAFVRRKLAEQMLSCFEETDPILPHADRVKDKDFPLEQYLTDKGFSVETEAVRQDLDILFNTFFWRPPVVTGVSEHARETVMRAILNRYLAVVAERPLQENPSREERETQLIQIVFGKSAFPSGFRVTTGDSPTAFCGASDCERCMDRTSRVYPLYESVDATEDTVQWSDLPTKAWAAEAEALQAFEQTAGALKNLFPEKRIPTTDEPHPEQPTTPDDTAEWQIVLSDAELPYEDMEWTDLTPEVSFPKEDTSSNENLTLERFWARYTSTWAKMLLEPSDPDQDIFYYIDSDSYKKELLNHLQIWFKDRSKEYYKQFADALLYQHNYIERLKDPDKARVAYENLFSEIESFNQLWRGEHAQMIQQTISTCKYGGEVVSFLRETLHQAAIEKHRRRNNALIRNALEDLKLARSRTKRDGDCFFSAVAVLMTSPQKQITMQTVRSDLKDFLISNTKNIDPFHPEDSVLSMLERFGLASGDDRVQKIANFKEEAKHLIEMAALGGISESAKDPNGNGQWGTLPMIPFLAALYQRPLGCISPTNTGTNGKIEPLICNVDLFTGKSFSEDERPFFLLFNGTDHWDATLRKQETGQQNIPVEKNDKPTHPLNNADWITQQFGGNSDN